jgi:hypothetical protein
LEGEANALWPVATVPPTVHPALPAVLVPALPAEGPASPHVPLVTALVSIAHAT